jgi:hypothetical protein
VSLGLLLEEYPLEQGLAELATYLKLATSDVTSATDVLFDEADGYPYLRQRAAVDGEAELPRLIQRRQLSYPVSLILVLLRKRLTEFDATGGDTRLVVSRDQVADQVPLFLSDTANEARLLDRIDAHLNKVIELGFLCRRRDRMTSSKCAAF